MADCHDLFLKYDSKLKLTSTRKESLEKSRKKLRKTINDYFDEKKKDEIKPEFYSQGSFVMDTIINPIANEEGNIPYDIDDGIYFIGDENEDERKTIPTYHEWIYKAVEDHTGQKPIKKNTCVRVMFSDGHNIDLPIYYFQKGTDKPELAHKKDGWIVSDPLEFIEWFENKANSKNNLKRIVRYMKGWCDYKKGDMPSGLIMTILTANNISVKGRDDETFYQTLVNIKDSLDNNFVCYRPTTPNDEDLFKDYSDSNRTYFLSVLENFINDAKKALEHPNQKDACLKWQKHFGPRFGCSQAKDETDNAKKYSSPAVISQNAKSA